MSNKAMFTLYRIGFCRYGTLHFQQQSGAEQYCSGAETASKAAILVPGRGGALECNLTGRCPFSKNPHNPFRKKICISIPCFGIIRLQKPKTIGKELSIVLENNSLLFLNK